MSQQDNWVELGLLEDHHVKVTDGRTVVHGVLEALWDELLGETRWVVSTNPTMTDDTPLAEVTFRHSDVTCVDGRHIQLCPMQSPQEQLRDSSRDTIAEQSRQKQLALMDLQVTAAIDDYEQLLGFELAISGLMLAVHEHERTIAHGEEVMYDAASHGEDVDAAIARVVVNAAKCIKYIVETDTVPPTLVPQPPIDRVFKAVSDPTHVEFGHLLSQYGDVELFLAHDDYEYFGLVIRGTDSGTTQLFNVSHLVDDGDWTPAQRDVWEDVLFDTSTRITHFENDPNAEY